MVRCTLPILTKGGMIKVLMRSLEQSLAEVEFCLRLNRMLEFQ